MLGGFVGGLLVAWILSFFGVDNMLIDVIQPFTTVALNVSQYYVAFGVLGMIGGMFGK